MIPINEIVKWFESKGNQILGKPDHATTIIAPRAIGEAKADHITFATAKIKSQFSELINVTESKLIVVDKQLLVEVQFQDPPAGKTFVVSDNPKGDIIDFCRHFFDFQKAQEGSEIHPSAVIREDVILGENIRIGAFVEIAAGCTIGDYADIGSGTVIKNADIGSHVEIGSNTVIGGTGFGYAKIENADAYAQFPHYGRVIIHDHVGIGSNTCIDRGSLSDTVIEEGVKIDNLVHIAHNVRIGKNSLVIACSMIAGSTVIGENCWIAPSSTIRNAITVGKNATIGLAATVTKDVEEGRTVMGSPAVSIDEFLLLRKIQKQTIDTHKLKG